MEVSLTSFVDFATKSGMGQISALREIQRQHTDEYAPYRDFYKQLREGIVAFHRCGGTQKGELDRLAMGLSDKKKIPHYHLLITGYKRFLGRKQIAWFEPERTVWQEGELTVKMNPELGLTIAGDRYLVKLYFKQRKLSKRLAEPLLHLMMSTLAPQYDQAVPTMAILDIRHANFLTFSGDVDPNILWLLAGHARAFLTMYAQVR